MSGTVSGISEHSFPSPQEYFYPLSLLKQKESVLFDTQVTPDIVNKILTFQSLQQIDLLKEDRQIISVEEAKKLINNGLREGITGEYWDILLQRLINVLKQEKVFSDNFFQDLEHFPIGKIKNNYTTILLSEINHIVELKNIDKEVYEAISKLMPNLQRTFAERTERVDRYRDTLYNFQDLGNKKVDIDHISFLINEKFDKVEGLEIDISSEGNGNIKGKINLFTLNVILNNFKSNFVRYGEKGVLKVVFSENSFDIFMNNTKKVTQEVCGTGLGNGIIKRCVENIFGGNVEIDEQKETYEIRLKKLNYS